MKILKNSSSNILVIGDLMIDRYLFGDSTRISPEASVLVVDVKKEDSLLGGAGNVLNNLKAFGANASVESDIAKEVKFIDFIDRKSTTKTIEKIRGQND